MIYNPPSSYCACGCGRLHLNTILKHDGVVKLWFRELACLKTWEKAHATG